MLVNVYLRFANGTFAFVKAYTFPDILDLEKLVDRSVYLDKSTNKQPVGRVEEVALIGDKLGLWANTTMELTPEVESLLVTDKWKKIISSSTPNTTGIKVQLEPIKLDFGDLEAQEINVKWSRRQFMQEFKKGDGIWKGIAKPALIYGIAKDGDSVRIVYQIHDTDKFLFRLIPLTMLETHCESYFAGRKISSILPNLLSKGTKITLDKAKRFLQTGK